MSRAMVGGTVSTKFKVVLLGDSGVGKSSLVARLIDDDFSHSQRSTTGASFLHHTVELEDCTVNLDIWDTAGQERYRALAKMYYRGASAAVVAYDVTSYHSFEKAKQWVTELIAQSETRDLVIVLAGTKADLANDNPQARSVQYDEAKAYAADNDFQFMETSAKTGDKVSDLFTSMARQLAARALGTQYPESPQAATRLAAQRTARKRTCC